ncbi:von Willebrand factor A domain-containing protein 7-like isoform X4 [Porites lutea]|uniref:von Willebrand factor A domain-containing protein 7-like isoform X4 n=1 Tax=Porites lutea TaxID=51062 RepID=UPI003CC66A33
MKTTTNAFTTIPSDKIKDSLDPSMRKDLPKDLLMTFSDKSGVLEPIILVPVKEKVIINQTKREVYKSRTSPSNKFMKAINDIELAEANANALGVKYGNATLAKLKSLVEKAIQSKSFIYARQIVGQIMYLLSAKAAPSDRTKRSSKGEGSKFLQDLRQKVGAATFDSFLAVQGDVALMFAIDDTGSMGDEILAAKNIAADIINYKRKVPIKEYILSAFNDPYPDPMNVNPVTVKLEAEAGEFEREIRRLRAHGGGDCPEYTFHGIREALFRLTIPRSPMYVFTDAGPKDATALDIEEVKLMVQDYDVVVNFLTTGYCNASLKYSVPGNPKNLHQVFKDLAKSTSGLAIMFNNKGELEQVTNLTIGTLEGDSIVGDGSTTGGRTKRSADGSSVSRYNIPVDDSMEKMSVTINTAAGAGHDITLQDPENVEITSGKLSLSYITIYEITNPKRGTWTLTAPGKNGDHEFSVKTSSDTNVDFEHYFLIALSWRRGHNADVPISNPVTGKLNKIIITVAGSEKLNSSSLLLQLISTEGNLISDFTLQPQSRGHFIASFNPHALVPSFKLKLKGVTQNGYHFERISRKTVRPTTAVLRVKYASNLYTLPLGRTTFIHFLVCNFGTTEIFHIEVLKDRLGYIVRRGRHRNPKTRKAGKLVIKGRCVVFSVYAKSTRSEDVGKTDPIYFILKGQKSKVVISQTVHLLVDN